MNMLEAVTRLPKVACRAVAVCAVCAMLVAYGASCSRWDDDSTKAVGRQTLNGELLDSELLRELLDAGLPGFHEAVGFLRSSRQDSSARLYTRVAVLKSFHTQYSWYPYEYEKELRVISDVLRDLLESHDALRKRAVLYHARGYSQWGTPELTMLILELCPDAEVGLMARTYCHEVFEDILQLDVAYSDSGGCGGTVEFPWRTVRAYYAEILSLRTGVIDPVTQRAALHVPVEGEREIRAKYRKLIKAQADGNAGSTNAPES